MLKPHGDGQERAFCCGMYPVPFPTYSAVRICYDSGASSILKIDGVSSFPNPFSITVRLGETLYFQREDFLRQLSAEHVLKTQNQAADPYARRAQMLPT